MKMSISIKSRGNSQSTFHIPISGFRIPIFVCSFSRRRWIQIQMVELSSVIPIEIPVQSGPVRDPVRSSAIRSEPMQASWDECR